MCLFKKSLRDHVPQAGNHFAEFSNSIFPRDVLQTRLARKYHGLFFQRGGEGRAAPPARAWVPTEGLPAGGGLVRARCPSRRVPRCNHAPRP